MNTITIIVSGKRGVGKTAIRQFICEQLHGCLGIDCGLDDAEFFLPTDDVQRARRDVRLRNVLERANIVVEER